MEKGATDENFLYGENGYYYDIWTDILYYEQVEFYTDSSANGVIYDVTTETILNK